MNRSIKFRVWITPWGNSEPYMQYIDDLHLHIYIGNWERGGYKDTIFQQYTGCNDAYNKEIFEGDIVQYNNGDVIRIGYVGFMAGIFFLNYPDETDDELGYLLVSNLKVIGNKFEHSELLK